MCLTLVASFEDGRKGVLKGDVAIVDMETYPVESVPTKEAAE